MALNGSNVLDTLFFHKLESLLVVARDDLLNNSRCRIIFPQISHCKNVIELYVAICAYHDALFLGAMAQYV